MQIHTDIEQGTKEWLDLRLGLITCSEIKTIRADGAGAQTYINGLAYERITGEPSKIFEGNEWTNRGHELEHVARDLYQQKTGHEVEEVSFIENLGFGYSPDGLIGLDGAMEIKAKQPQVQISIAYCPNLPIFIKRVYAEERKAQLEKLNTLIEKYNKQIDDVVNQIMEMY